MAGFRFFGECELLKSNRHFTISEVSPQGAVFNIDLHKQPVYHAAARTRPMPNWNTSYNPLGETALQGLIFSSPLILTNV